MEDLYSRNPARDVENFAVDVLREWIGDQGTVTNTASGNGPDFRVDYADGRLGLGEVAWHEDPKIREMWSRTFKHSRHQQIDLRPGSGQWSVALVRGAKIKHLYATLPDLVAALLGQGCLWLDVDNHSRGTLVEAARRLGIEHISQVSADEPSTAIFFMPSSGGTVPLDPNVICDWIEAVIADHDYLDMTAKLTPLAADERHIFIMSGSRTPFGVQERLRSLVDSRPTRRPHLPPGISHVWVVSQFGEGSTGLWSTDLGWGAVPSPASAPDN
jgi:hypothetical protein